RNPRFLLQTAAPAQPILHPAILAALPRIPMSLRVFLSLGSKFTPTLVALFVCLLAPSFAGASCGDYVMVAGVQEHAGRSVARHEISVSLAHRHHPDSPRHDTPCTGPFCSQGRPLPPPTPPAPPSVEVEEWGCPVALVSLPGANVPASLLAHPAASPIRYGATIYHPPR